MGPEGLAEAVLFPPSRDLPSSTSGESSETAPAAPLIVCQPVHLNRSGTFSREFPVKLPWRFVNFRARNQRTRGYNRMGR
jgi:hypothetical protein